MKAAYQRAAWKGVLAAINDLIAQQPGAYQHKQSGRWLAPYGLQRTPASYGDDGTVSSTLSVNRSDGTRTYEIHVRIEERDS